MTSIAARTEAFTYRFGMRLPVLMAPMAGACPPALAAAVANAGGMGACGALQLQPDAIADWAAQVRAATNGAFQINLWIPDPPPHRDPAHETALRSFLANWGPPVTETAGDAVPPDFGAQCEAMLAARPAVVSSIMGLYLPDFVARLKHAGIAWFATVTTVAEARAAEAAGADAVVAQGMEAGGHRGSFNAADAEQGLVGLFALLPAVVDAVDVPVVATGGISDPRTSRRRCAGRHRVFALSGGGHSRAVGGRAGAHAAGGHHADPGVQWPGWAQHGYGIRPCRRRAGRAKAGALPGAARPDRRHACGRAGSRRRGAHAGLGRPVRWPRPRRARWGADAGAVGCHEGVAELELCFDEQL